MRAGVAPDHPKIKSVTRVYDKIAQNPAFRFFGGVRVGADMAPASWPSAITPSSTRWARARGNGLGITGEDLAGVHSATGVRGLVQRPPGARRPPVRPRRQRAVVIGNGNVAIDVARMLVLDAGELAPTDTADARRRRARASAVREVRQNSCGVLMR